MTRAALVPATFGPPRSYLPDIVSIGGGAAPEPVWTLGAGGLQRGEYSLSGGWCCAQIQLKFGAGSAFGAGALLAFTLPVPAARGVFAADRPIGTAWCLGPFHVPTLIAEVTIADALGITAPPAGLTEDQCAQMFLGAHAPVRGTTAVGIGNTFVDVSPGVSSPLGMTANDFRISPITQPDAGQRWWHTLQSGGAADVAAVYRVNLATAAAAVHSFTWECAPIGGQFVRYNVPFTWVAGYALEATVLYPVKGS